jgi:hypothetical protein
VSHPTSREPPVASVRAQRVEIVDADGRVRVVLGALEAPGGSPSFGMTLLAADGRARAWLALPPAGPELVLTLAGNVVVHVGVSDPGLETVDEGAYLHLSGPDGAPVIGWQVTGDGTVTIRRDGDQ